MNRSGHVSSEKRRPRRHPVQNVSRSQTADTPIAAAINRYVTASAGLPTRSPLPAHLRCLEAESIEIVREVAAEFQNPVLLYSIGKDSGVLLHIIRKAFFPGRPIFPLLHVDTTWKFHDMIVFRDAMSAALNVELVVFTNQDGVARGINPIASGPSLHTQVMKTEALKQVVKFHGFDAVVGGGRRDEEKSRAKERIFSFRNVEHAWDPRNQRPELWNLYNTRIRNGESVRIFPLSNWTELDIWCYIAAEEIPVVPLYFSKVRPIVRRSGALIMVDDARLPLESGEAPTMMAVRFRTLGCHPLSGAIECHASSAEEIVAEILTSTLSERQGRLIDHDEVESMEKMKREGYFWWVQWVSWLLWLPERLLTPGRKGCYVS